MENIVGKRIQARIEELGKNLSSVALEAGLGRSSVRDIVLGRVSSPRIDTLKKIAAALHCTAEYLSGDSDEPNSSGVHLEHWYLNATIDRVTAVEAGVFRPVRPRDRSPYAQKTSTILEVGIPEPRLPEYQVKLYVMKDNSLEGIGVFMGDGLTGVEHPYDLQIPLNHGALVAVRQSLKDLEIEEISVRQVEVRDDGVALVCGAGSSIAPIVIPNASIDNESTIIPNFYPLGKTSVEIMHLITRVTRELPIADAVYEIPPIPD